MRGKELNQLQPCGTLRITPAHAGKRGVCSFYDQYNKDHPRACGEKLIVSVAKSCHLGSPPRMRGKVFSLMKFRSNLRITPAHAGKRMVIWLLLMVSRGSPPRMRGKDQMFAAPRPLIGITPAHAGKSDTCPIRSGDSRDHPRACGEKNIPTHHGILELGSPPRMRGKAISAVVQLFGDRITPAHAGKSYHR